MFESRVAAAIMNLEDGSLFVTGGLSANEPLSTVECFSSQTNTWNKKRAMRQARVQHCIVCVHGNTVFVLGGYNQALIQELTTCELYDPLLDIWLSPPCMKQKRRAATAVSLNNKIYIFGGIGGNSLRLSSCECYDLSFSIWTWMTEMPTGRAFAQSVGISDYYIAILGGDVNCSIVDTVLLYDITRNIWHNADWTLPTPLETYSNGLSCHMIMFTQQLIVSSARQPNKCWMSVVRNNKFHLPSITPWETLESSLP